jgi:CubicO group peptidase (beta-lactamase class C family)
MRGQFYHARHPPNRRSSIPPGGRIPAAARQSGSSIVLALVLALVGVRPSFAQPRPVTGTPVAEYAPLEQALPQFMDRIGCQALTVGVSKNNKLVYSRGFGWSDAHKKKPTAPDALMRIAGLTEPITSAVVKGLIRDGKLTLETQVFPLLNVKLPRGANPDPRLNKITVGQLLVHKGGWDAKTSFDPFGRVGDIEKSLGLRRRARSADILRYMLDQPLQFDPGERVAMSNFGYFLLGRVIEKTTGKLYGEYITSDFLKPLGIDDAKLAHNAVRLRDKREVWYPSKEVPVDLMDANAGLVASAPDVCKFLDHYWLSGEPRQADQDLQWAYFGNLASTTAMARQRPDGSNVVVLCNARRGESSQEDDDNALLQLVEQALDAASNLGSN